MPLTPLSIDSLWAIEPRIMAAAQKAVEALSAEDAQKLMLAYSMDDDGDKSDAPPYKVEAGVATIELHGMMMKGAGWLLSFLGGTDTPTFTSSMMQAAIDPSIKAIYIDIDSPGGMIAGVVEATEAVQYARSLKPTHAFVADCCASAAYWIGSQASSIHGSAGAMIGAIGVYQTLTDSSKMAERMGLKVHVVGSGDMKGAGEDGTEITPEILADRQRMVDSVAKLFVGAVAKGRKMKPEAVNALADGRSWFGKEAVSKGLMDGVASRSNVINALRGYKPGRQAVHIAAKSFGEVHGENKMSLWDQFKAALGGNSDTIGEPPPDPFLPQATIGAKFEGANPLKAAMDAQAEEIKLLKAAHEDNLKAANRSACEAFMKAGAFTAAELEANIALRATAPEVFDKLMAGRPANPLTFDAISGEEAVARVDPSQAQGFLAACKEYYRSQKPGYVPANTQNGGNR